MAQEPDFFHGAGLKLKRANHHIDHLESIFARYTKENLNRIRRYNKNSGRDKRGINIGEPLPQEVPAILGDAVHNLRVSLDYAYCVLVEKNGGTIGKRTFFPFGGDRQSLEGSIKGQKPTVDFPSDAAMAFILDELQPYAGGKLGLYGLHQLDITDKHHVLIPASRTFTPGGFTFVSLNGAPTRVGNGLRIISLAGQYGQETGPGMFIRGGTIKFDHEPEGAFDVCFGNGQPFEDKSILATLHALSNDVTSALDALRQFI